MPDLTDVLKSPSVWTGKDGVSGVTDILKNSGLQDKIQFGSLKSSFDTLVKTGEIVAPGASLKAPTGLLYNAAANAGKSLISPSAGLTEMPKSLGTLASGSLSDLTSGLSGKLNDLKGAAGALGGLKDAASGALGAATGALSGVTGALSGALGTATGALGGVTGALDAVNSISGSVSSISKLANNGTAQLGGLLANASKFGVPTAVEWAKTTSGATGAIAGISGALSGGVGGGVANVLSGGVGAAAGAITGALGGGLGKLAGGAAGALSGALGGAAGAALGAASKLTSGLTSKMDSLAKQGEFAVNFSDTKLPAAVAGVIPAAGFKGTIDRSTLNAATAKLVGSDKIALPSFSPQALDTSALTDAASKAKGLLAGGLDAGGLLSKATGALGGAGGLGNLASGALGALSGAAGIGGLSGVASLAAGALGGGGGLAGLASSTDSIMRGRAGLSPDSASSNFAAAEKALKLQEEYEKLVAEYGRNDPRAIAALDEMKAVLKAAGM